MKVGDPQSAETELGPMISDEHLANVVSYIELGQQQGATLVRDGREGMPDVGSYLGPTIFTDVTPDMTIPCGRQRNAGYIKGLARIMHK